MAQDLVQDRVAHNQSIFREANEGIQEAASEHQLEEPHPFICECADPRCTEIIRVSAAEYAEVRRNPIRFLNAPGHHEAAGPHSRVVESRDGHEVVEKVGEAAERAAELDPRSD